jgi:hypothetical protein
MAAAVCNLYLAINLLQTANELLETIQLWIHHKRDYNFRLINANSSVHSAVFPDHVLDLVWWVYLSFPFLSEF